MCMNFGLKLIDKTLAIKELHLKSSFIALIEHVYLILIYYTSNRTISREVKNE